MKQAVKCVVLGVLLAVGCVGCGKEIAGRSKIRPDVPDVGGRLQLQRRAFPPTDECPPRSDELRTKGNIRQRVLQIRCYPE